MNDNLKYVINKVHELCREKIYNNVLIIKTDKKLCTEMNFLKAKLPINKFFDASKMPSWELLKMPKKPGTYIIEGLEQVNEEHKKAIYGWALNGKANGVRAVITTKDIPSYITSKTQQIVF